MKNILLLLALCLLPLGCKNDSTEDSNCDDCPCPDWAKKEFLYYREKTFPTIGMLFYMEKDGVPYFAINDFTSSCITCKLRFFEADGTEIVKDHPGYETLVENFLEGKFLYNGSCT